MAGQRSESPVSQKRNVLGLAAASFFNDTATEIAYWILPLFLTRHLGVGAVALGWIEGMAEGMTSFARLLSGHWTDRVGRRKPFVVTGYIVSNVAKPLLALVTAVGQVAAIRTTDRLAKGFRTPPRDAMLAESIQAGARGSAFGFRQAMDSAGALAGPLLAFWLLARGFGLRAIFAAAAIPGMLSILTVIFAVRETGSAERSGERTEKVALGPRYHRLLLAVGLFALANSSDLFLVLRAQGFGIVQPPLLGLVFNLSYTALAWPCGKLSDRLPRRWLLATGYAVFAAVYLGFARAGSARQIWLLFAFYGVYYALSESVLKALVADIVPRASRGRAYGLLAALYGVLVVGASVLTGQLWQHFGAQVPFYLSAVLAMLAALLVLRV